MPPPRSPQVRNATSGSIQAPEVKDSQDSSGQSVRTPAKNVDNSTFFTNSPRQFAQKLLILADGLELEVDPSPLICGKTVPLFDLWQVVTSGAFGGFDEVNGRKKWAQVAQKLGFKDPQLGQAGIDLQACYSEILADLEEGEREAQESEDMDSEQAAELIADQLRHTADQPDSADDEEDMYTHGEEWQEVSAEEHEELLRELEENDDDLNHIQISPQCPQPPFPPAGKRRLGSDRRSSELPYNKRQRVDKGKGKEQLEIPSTPEDIINSTQMGRPAHQPSPLKFEHAKPASPSADSSIEEIRPIRFERKRPAAAQQLEPETQDFYHSSPTYSPFPQEEDLDAEDEVIPGSHLIHQEQSDEDDEEQSVSGMRRPPQVQGRSPQRNSSNATTRGTLHSSNTISNAATRGTINSSSTNYDSSTQSQTESQKDALLEAFITKHVSDGYAQDVVIEALESTSMSIKETLAVAATRGTINSSSTNYDSSTQSQTESQKDALLEAFITKHVSDGYAQDVVIEALESTSMSIKETLAVMESLANGEGIPEDMPGVWTSWDDEALRVGRGTEEYNRILRKHGISRIAMRKKYLRDVQAAEEQ